MEEKRETKNQIIIIIIHGKKRPIMAKNGEWINEENVERGEWSGK